MSNILSHAKGYYEKAIRTHVQNFAQHIVEQDCTACQVSHKASGMSIALIADCQQYGSHNFTHMAFWCKLDAMLRNFCEKLWFKFDTMNIPVFVVVSNTSMKLPFNSRISEMLSNDKETEMAPFKCPSSEGY